MLTFVLAGCAAPLGSASVFPGASGSVGSPLPSSSPAPTLLSPRPSLATAKPSASPWSSSAKTLTWHRLGAFAASGVDGLIGFAKGYVALEGSAGAVWHSPDGRSWKRVKLPFDLPLKGAQDPNGLLGRVITTNGEEVLVVGGYSHQPCEEQPPGDTGGDPECAISPIAWVSDDGLTWRRLHPEQVGGVELVAAWPASAGGWNAAASDWYGVALGGNALSHSEDGTRWVPASKPPAGWEGYEHAPLGVANGSGQYLLAASERGGPGTTLAAMVDGGSWRVLDGFPGKGAEVTSGIGSNGVRPRWVLGGTSGCVVEEGCNGGPTIWTSTDGVAWTTTTLPTGAGVPGADPPVVVSSVASLARSERGYVGVGVDGSWSEGARHETWVSDDSASWTLLPQTDRPRFDYGPGIVANGPHGVVGISASAKDKESIAWELR